jgi:retinol dehydrogenase 12
MSAKRIGIVSQLIPPEPHWKISGVPDQTGKVVIVTGGNQGIGRQMAKVNPSSVTRLDMGFLLIKERS